MIIYNLILFILYPLIILKILINTFIRKDSFKFFLCKVGLGKCIKQENCIWIHASSLGETKSAIKIIDEIKSKNAEAHFVVSTSTSSPIKLLKDRKNNNNIYELGGEIIDSFEELLKILLDIKNIKRFLIPLNPKLMMVPAFFLQNLPKPPFTVDQMILLKTDNILKNGLPGLKDLGIKLSDMKTELLKIY